MKKLNREELLRALQSVQPGLANREHVEQTTCFVFKDGHVHTFNEETACRMPFAVDFEGAVQAASLIAILDKLTEDTVEIGIDSEKEGELLILGKSNRRCGLVCDATIHLALHKIEAPDTWKKLHDHFTKGVAMAQHCAGTDESQFNMTCVHIHPKYVEACDNAQMTRVMMKTGVQTELLVKREAIANITMLDMKEFSETPSWIHFRNAKGLELSCRRYVEEYPSLDHLLEVEGPSVLLPQGLVEAAEKAAVFSVQGTDDAQVSIVLTENKLRIKGTCALGWYAETKKVEYTGPEIAFKIKPELLQEITKKKQKAVITEKSMKVQDENWVYITSLGVLAKKKKIKK